MTTTAAAATIARVYLIFLCLACYASLGQPKAAAPLLLSVPSPSPSLSSRRLAGSSPPTFKPTAPKPTKSPTAIPTTISPTTFAPTEAPTTATPSEIPTPRPSPIPSAAPTYPVAPLPTANTEKAYIVVYISVIFSLLTIACVMIVHNYAEPNFPKFSYLSLTVGYLASFGILLLVPIDIANAVVSRRTTDISGLQYFPNSEILSTMYTVLFNTILFMGSLWLCIEEYYHTDGYFNPFFRLMSSIWRFLRDTMAGLIFGIIILIILISKHVVGSDSSALQLTANITTNIIYETFLMFLLGYGLVEYPRTYWSCANLDYYYTQAKMQALSAFKAVHDCKLEISLRVGDVLKTKEQLSAYGDQKLKDAMEVLISEMPKNQYGQFEFKSSKMGEVATNKSGQITIDSLADLRMRLKYARDQYKMSQLISEQTNMLAYNLEDMITAREGPDRFINWSLRGSPSTLREYNWYIRYRPLLWRATAVFTAALSILSFIGVCCSMYGVDPQKSPYFLAVHADTSSVGAIVIFVFITFGYTVYVTMWALFQMRFAGMMNLVPGQTTPEALSFNVRMVARLAAPLVFFYLGWIAENGLNNGQWTWNRAEPTQVIYMFYPNGSHVFQNSSWIPPANYTDDGILISDITDVRISMPSAFSEFYNLQSVGVIKKSFGTIFPVILFIIIALIAPNLLNRFFILVKMENYQFGTQLPTEAELSEGEKQLERFKKVTISSYRKAKFRGFIAGLNSDDTGCWGWIMGATQRAPADDNDRLGQRRLSSVMASQKPPPEFLSSQVDRKKTGGMFGTTWKKQWAQVIGNGTLAFYEGTTEPSADATPIDTFDVVLIMATSLIDKEVKNEVKIDFADGDIFIKLPNPEEAEKWKTALAEWNSWAKDHRIDRGGGGGGGGGSDDVGGDPDVEKRAALDKISKMDDLDDIDIEGVGDVSKPTSSSASSSGGYKAVPPPTSAADKNDKPKDSKAGWNPFSRGKEKAVEMTNATSPSIATPKAPPALEGKVSKKIEHSHNPFHIGDIFHDRFFKINDSGSLYIMKSPGGMDDNATIVIDLKKISRVGIYNKKGQEDPCRFNIEVSDHTYKLKSDSPAECQKWVSALNDWKEYLSK